MLVCSVSLRPKRGTLAATVYEIATATDSPSINAVFAILADDNASASDTVSAFVGKIMVEAASAADVFDAGSLRYAAIVEETGAAASPSATVVDSSGGIPVAMAEAATAENAQDADIVSALAVAAIDGTFVSATSASTVLGTEALDSGPVTVFEP